MNRIVGVKIRGLQWGGVIINWDWRTILIRKSVKKCACKWKIEELWGMYGVWSGPSYMYSCLCKSEQIILLLLSYRLTVSQRHVVVDFCAMVPLIRCTGCSRRCFCARGSFILLRCWSSMRPFSGTLKVGFFHVSVCCSNRLLFSIPFYSKLQLSVQCLTRSF